MSIIEGKRICFYTAIFSTTSRPIDKPVKFERMGGIDYILFTNYDPITFVDSSWTIIKQIPHLFTNPILSAKTVKWSSHKYLPEYDIVIWMDSFLSPSKQKMNIWHSHLKLIQESDVDFIICKHPERKCMYDEINACIKLGKDKRENINVNLSLITNDHYPKNDGLFATWVFMRKNHAPHLNTILDKMVKIMYNASHRDQLIMNYMFWKHKFIKYKLMDLKSLTAHTGIKGTHTYGNYLNINWSEVQDEDDLNIVCLRYASPQEVSIKEYVNICKVILQKRPCNILVYGLRNDAVLFSTLNNNGGHTIFVEDGNKCIQQIQTNHVVRQKFNTTVSESIANKCTSLYIKSSYIDLYEWDIIIMNGPNGHQDKMPGREIPIFEASNVIINNHKDVDIFIHDIDRPLEKMACDKFFANYIPNIFDRTYHYKRGGSPLTTHHHHE